MRELPLTRIGVTGHTNLSSESAPIVAKSIRTEILKTLDLATEVVGVSCLARGPDQIFARVILDLGGSLEVVLPATDYRHRLVKPDNAEEFDELIGRACRVHVMPFERSNRDAYMAASEYVLESVDSMIAVWDGGPSGGTGGTADVVTAARKRGIPVTVLWPAGAWRT